MSSYNKITKTDLADGALYEKVNDMVDALNADKIERSQVGIRKGSTAYKVGDKCFCEYHGDFLLECTTAGTSAVGQLDTSGTVTDGATRTDGSVVWTFRSVATKKELNDVKNSSLDKTQITNCLTYIPQDIKLELVDGTLTLAQGCKGYMGDGTVRTTTGTPTLKNTGGSQMFLHITSGGTGLYAGYMTGGTVSERPSSPITYASYYNTNTKKCEYYNGSSWVEVSLPIAIVTRGTDGYTSIDQVFNGFGYVGSTMFILPGVKGLISNGRNANGTLKNTAFTVNSLLTRTLTGTFDAVLGTNGGYIGQLSIGDYSFDYENNYTMNGNLVWNYAIIGTFTETSGVISNFQPKTTFHAVDYNEVKSVVFPSQTGKAGKALLTDGENAYWGDTSGVIIRDWSS